MGNYPKKANLFRKVWEPVVYGIKEFRSIFSARPDDLIFRCRSCGRDRIYGISLGIGIPPENLSPLLCCHNIRAHKEVKITVHDWVSNFHPEEEPVQ